MTGRTIAELSVGEEACVSRPISPDTIREFVLASGDGNPIHSDPAFAAQSRFGRIIAPGMLTAGLLSAVIGTRLPGPGTIYLSQELRFLRPVYVGDTITARATVVALEPERNRARLATACENQDGQRVLEGEACVMPPRARVEYAPPARPLSWAAAACGPATVGFQLLSWWVAGSLALADQTLRLWGVPARATDADPIRP